MATVYVGLSGGVDSSVAAALLQQHGHRVVGVHMQNWTANVGGVECPWQQDLLDAKAAAVKLGIPFKVFDFQTEYRQLVVDIMVAEYRAGRTPNPDVLCNQEIKFKLFLETALAEGADMIATGHYARKADGKLLAGSDDNKDQSYFLYRLNREALDRSLMPLGGLTKVEVRKLANKLDLPTANKKDSQGICFVGPVGLKPFLSQYIESRPGPIRRARDGALLGYHDGAAFFTIGQRHGLGIGGGQPLYVTRKDVTSNTVWVTDDADDLQLQSDEFTIADCHWINHPPETGRNYRVKVRYRSQSIECALKPSAGGYTVKLARPERAISAGQSAVVYDGDEVLGGGFILAHVPKNSLLKEKTLVKT